MTDNISIGVNMSAIKPYETRTGKLVNTSKIEQDLIRYITEEHINDEISYEYKDQGYKWYFITGRNPEEKQLPFFDFPIFFSNIRHQPSIAIDVRPYVVNVKQPFDTLASVLRDRYAVNFKILQAYITYRVDEDEGSIRPIIPNIMCAFSAIISNAVNRITQLPAPDRIGIEIASSIYAYHMFYPANDLEDDVERLTAILAKSKLSFPIDKRLLRDQVETIITHANVKGLDGMKVLEQLLSAAIAEDMRGIVNFDTICKMLDNAWYGPGSTKAIYVALESVGTLVAMIYSCGASQMYKSSKIAIALDAKKRQIDMDQIVHYINNVLVKGDLEKLF